MSHRCWFAVMTIIIKLMLIRTILLHVIHHLHNACCLTRQPTSTHGRASFTYKGGSKRERQPLRFDTHLCVEAKGSHEQAAMELLNVVSFDAFGVLSYSISILFLCNRKRATHSGCMLIPFVLVTLSQTSSTLRIPL